MKKPSRRTARSPAKRGSSIAIKRADD